MGSHGGKTRIIRHAYAEGSDYVPLVQRADALWHELEAATGTHFLTRTGCLDIAAPGLGQARAARESARRHNLPHEWLSGAEVNRRWPAWRLPDDWEVCYSPDAGFLEVEPAMRAMAAELRRHGGTLLTQQTVTDGGRGPDGIWVATEDTRYESERLLYTAGAYSIEVLSLLALPLEVRRKPVFWFDVADHGLFEPERFPVFIAETPEGEFYGLPTHGEPGIKAGVHSGGQLVSKGHIDTVDREIYADDYQDDLAPFMSRYLAGVSGEIVASTVCLYTMTPDEHFLIDRHPEDKRIVFASGFSGHGFKFAPVIGEHLAALALDPAVQPYPDFVLGRFAASLR
jgi:monomeric sarcosine oxidase